MSSHIPAFEALLFIHGEPLSQSMVARVLGISEDEVRSVAEAFRGELARAERGLVLVEHQETYLLATKPDHASIVESFVKEGLKEDLTPAATETLSLIAYFGPITRAQIDFVRGVNSSFILRALLVRGLIERVVKGNAYEYHISTEFLKYMGITRIDDLPRYTEYQSMKENLFASDNVSEPVTTPRDRIVDQKENNETN